MIGMQLANPLLVVARGDESLRSRLDAIATLSRLPLDEEVWRALAVAAAPVLRELDDAQQLDDASVQVMARIPVRSLRERLRRIARDDTHALSLTVAIALAREGDLAAVERLLDALATAPSEIVAQTLASLALERIEPPPSLFESALRHDDPMVRFWTVIALERIGAGRRSFQQLWRVLARKSGDQDVQTGEATLSEPPPLFWGDPSVAYNQLAALRPLPRRTLLALLDLYSGEVQRRRREEGPDGAPSREATLFYGALSGGLDAEGSPVPRGESVRPGEITVADRALAESIARRLVAQPLRGQRVNADWNELLTLRALTPRKAGEILSAGVEALVRELWGITGLGFRKGENVTRTSTANNALLQLVVALPRPIDVSPSVILASSFDDPFIRRTLDWTIAQLAPERLVREIGPRIQEASGGERRALLERMRGVVEQIGAPPPFTGLRAGGSSESGPPPRKVIDDGAPATQNAGVHTLFPDIAFSELHPIVGVPLAVEVTLSSKAVAGVRGTVALPDSPPEMVHVFRVHLLMGEASLWDTLEYSQARGNIKGAHFDLFAPELTEGDRLLAEVKVNFYLNARWAGEGSRFVDVRRNAGVVPLGDIPTPEEPEWRRVLNIEPGALPPDLIVRIQRTKSVGEYVWSCLSPHLDFPPPDDPLDERMALGKNAEEWVRDQFVPLAELTLEDMDIAEIEGVGEAIYQSTAFVFKESYWALWRAAEQGKLTFESVQIVTDEPYIPWELMRIFDDMRAPEVDPEFLSIRHSVGRWLATDSARLTQKIPVSRVAVAASSYTGIADVAELPGARQETEAFVKRYKATEVKLASKELLDFLEHGDASAVHISCHGTMSVSAPLTSTLTLEDVPNKLRPTHVNRAEVRRGLGRAHPLVFLNACEVGGTAPSISLVAGFPAAFIAVGASAVVSPLWSIFDDSAFDISESFYRELFTAGGTRTVGAVMREIRAGWREKQTITYLAYVLYGDPLATVQYSAPA